MDARRAVPLLLVALIGPLGCDESSEPLSPTDSRASAGLPTPPRSDPTSGVIRPDLVYRRSDLPFTPSSINEAGDVVGTLRGDGRSRAVLWRNDALDTLPSLSDGDSQAADINDSGVVVGSSVDERGRSRAVRWIDGVPEDLGALDGGESAALGINQRGDVVGFSDRGGEPIGFLWSDGGLTPLNPLPPNFFGHAVDINDERIVVGWSAGGALQDATIWVDGVPAELPSLAYEASASAIGTDGAIVGGSIPDYQLSARGVLWVDGRVEELPTPPGVDFSSADDLNDRGQILGYAGGAALWQGDSYLQLDTVGYGVGINNRGQAVGTWLRGAAYHWEPRRAFTTRPSKDGIPPPPLPPAELTRSPRPSPSPSGFCRVPTIMSRKVEAALRVAGCIE